MEKWLLILLLVSPVLGVTLNADSCERADVVNAISMANEGDTVIVPPGTCTWTSKVSINKGIVLKGTGTEIRAETTDGSRNSVISFSVSEGKSFRLTGFTIRQVTDGVSLSMVTLYGNSKSWRIDHNRFLGEGQTDASIYISGPMQGVIDNNEMRGDNRILIMGNYGDSDSEWKKPLTLGTSKAIYIEDNVVEGSTGNIVDSNAGARWVFRHNDVTGKYVECHGVQWGRGTFSYEIYENDITDNANIWVPMSLRGGTGVIFNNHMHDFPTWAQFLIIYTDRSNRPGDYGLCDGTNPVDGNELSNGWPCLDQIGRSTDYSDSQVQPQAFEPLYEWNNQQDGNDFDIVVHSSVREYGHLQEGRDFYNDVQRPGYSPYVYPHAIRTNCLAYPLLCDSGSQAVQQCGNNYIEGSEVCDGNDLAGENCASQGFDSGNLACLSTCSGYDTSSCANSACSGYCCPSGYACTDQISGSCPGTCCSSSSACVSNSAFVPGQIVEAEDGTVNNMEIINGLVYATSDYAGSLSFDYDVQEGDYRIEAYIDNGNNAGSNSLFMGIDDEAAGNDNYYGYHSYEYEGLHWDNVSRMGTRAVYPPEYDPYVFHLDEGRHIITFYGREAYTKIDKIRLVENICNSLSLSGLIAVMEDWKSGTKNINEVMQSIQRWKNGC